jgi:hypothetical protein
MRVRSATVLLSVLLLLIFVHAPAYSACTCYVDGEVTLSQGCAARTIKLWVWEIVDVETGRYDWVFKGERTLHSGDSFHFVVQCAMGDCDSAAQIRDAGLVLASFNLPGRDETADLGTINDPNRCPKKPSSEVPAPGS